MFSSNDLSFFERLFEMGDGFVLDFTNATFRNFVLESVGIDVYDNDYLENVEQTQNSSSKANILRYFWRNESSSLVFKLTNDLVEYYELLYYDYDDSLLDKAKKIINKYSNSTMFINESLSSEDRILDLIKDINKTISEGEPIFALDRLHTLLHNTLRNICNSHDITFDKKDRIDSLLKKYVEFLKDNNCIESKMSETIFKQIGSLFAMFNHLRNNQTYVHDNTVLSNSESLLIFKQVVSIMEFISSVDDNFKL